MQGVWRDGADRYGRVTRLLHWTMAALLTWQLAGMAVKLIVGRAPITSFWVGSHVPVGTLLLALILVRIGWALAQRHRRPRPEPGLNGSAARIGHVLLYVLMLIVPVLAMARHLGAGRELAPFGLLLVPAREGRIEWLIAPADAVHGLLGWTLAALIAGHVVMVLVHRFLWKDDLTARMLGRRGLLRR